METNVASAPVEGQKKPAPLRLIFILNAVKILISTTFFIVFTIKETSVGPIGPQIVLYTTFGYLITFASMVFFIIKRNLWGMRIALFVDLVVSIPATAIIGLVLTLTTIIISFASKKVKAYFAYSG